MKEFYRQLAHGSRKWSLREQYLQRNTSLLPMALMKPEHESVFLTMILFTEGPEGGCHPSFWLLLSFWVPDPNSLEGFCRGWWKDDASSLTAYLCYTMNRHWRRMAGEALTAEWWLRRHHTYIRFSPSLLPLSPSSLSRKMCFEYKMSFFPLRATWLLAANPGKCSPVWHNPGPIRGHQCAHQHGAKKVKPGLSAPQPLKWKENLQWLPL